MKLTTPKILEQCPMFARLSPEDHARIADISGVAVRRRGELIFSEGEPADRFFVVLDGDVKLYKSSPQGREQILHIMRPFHTFAEAAVFLGGGYPASAAALHEARLLEIPRDKFLALVRADPDLALRVMASISAWLHRLVDLVDDLSLTEVPTRLARYLARLAAENRLKIADGVKVHLPMTKTDLAKVIGAAQETLSRVLARLAAEGVIAVKGREITVKDAARLKELAES